jgi:hypothetical protein
MQRLFDHPSSNFISAFCRVKIDITQIGKRGIVGDDPRYSDLVSITVQTTYKRVLKAGADHVGGAVVSPIGTKQTRDGPFGIDTGWLCAKRVLAKCRLVQR